MFRRKEENGADATAEAGQTSMSMTTPANHSATEAGSAATSAATQTAGFTTASSTSPYAPSSQSQAQQQQSPVARPAATAGYRAAAATNNDFARAANAARSNESMRPATGNATNAGSSNSSFSTLSDKASLKSNRRILTVGNDILLKGEIATCDRLVIEGRVEAKLSDVHTVEIAQHLC